MNDRTSSTAPADSRSAPFGVRVTSLPPAARARLGSTGRPWADHGRIGDELALRRLGFTPLGVVLGSVSSWGFPLPSMRPVAAPPMPLPSSVWTDGPMGARRRGGYVHDWAVSPLGAPRIDMGWTWEQVVHEAREREMIGRVIANLCTEARGLGAHGVVGIELARRLLGTDPAYNPNYELSIRGTAVGVAELERSDRIFTSGLGGADLFKLAEHGWAPLSFCASASQVKGVTGRSSRRALRSTTNGEVEQLSEVTGQALGIAVRLLEQGAPGGTELIVNVDTRIEAHGFEVNVLATGTAIRRMPGHGTTDPLAILPVVPLRGRSRRPSASE